MTAKFNTTFLHGFCATPLQCYTDILEKHPDTAIYSEFADARNKLSTCPVEFWYIISRQESYRDLWGFDKTREIYNSLLHQPLILAGNTDSGRALDAIARKETLRKTAQDRRISLNFPSTAIADMRPQSKKDISAWQNPTIN